MRTNAIPYFQIMLKVRHSERTDINAFILHITGVLHQMSQYKERGFVSKMPAHIPAGRVVPASVKHLEYSADFVIPTYGKIVTGKIGKVNKI